MSDPKPTNDHVGTDLLKADFAAIHAAHLAANEDFGRDRFRILLAVEAVPLLAIGALLTAQAGQGTVNVNLFQLPAPIYLVFFATFWLGTVVLRMWVRSAFLANTYARALNHFRGKYMDSLRELDILKGWEPLLPTDPRQPNWKTGRGAHNLSLLVAVFEGINFLYLLLAIVGFVMIGELGISQKLVALPDVVAGLVILAGAAAYAILRYFQTIRSLHKDQTAVEERYKTDAKADPGAGLPSSPPAER